MSPDRVPSGFGVAECGSQGYSPHSYSLRPKVETHCVVVFRILGGDVYTKRPSLDPYWLAINLFGRNVASYKFALGGA
jgi:hypothetical protein